MEVKPGYKQTNVGVIPEEWEVKRLGELATLKNGYAFKSDTYTTLGNFKVITIANVQDGYMTARECNSIACEPKDLQSHQRLQIGDILISMTGNVGRVCRVTEKNCLLNQRVGKLIPTAVDDATLFILLGQPSFIKAMTGVAKGGAQPNLSVSEISDHRFCVPASLPEQRAIATALSDVDGLLGGLDRLIAKKRDLKQAAMQQLLTGQTRLPGFHGEWEVKRLGELGEISGSGVDKKSRPDETPVRLLNYMDVYRRTFIFSEDLDHWVTAQPHQARRCAVQKGDVFFTPSSETRDDIANSAVAMEDISDAAYSYHVVRLRLKEPWDLRFRTYAFKPRSFLNQAETICDGGGTRYVISLGKFRSLTVNVPPVPEQTAIAEVLGDMDAELAALEQRREKTRALKQAMMQELLTGRTRLV